MPKWNPSRKLLLILSPLSLSFHDVAIIFIVIAVLVASQSSSPLLCVFHLQKTKNDERKIYRVLLKYNILFLLNIIVGSVYCTATAWRLTVRWLCVQFGCCIKECNLYINIVMPRVRTAYTYVYVPPLYMYTSRWNNQSICILVKNTSHAPYLYRTLGNYFALNWMSIWYISQSHKRNAPICNGTHFRTRFDSIRVASECVRQIFINPPGVLDVQKKHTLQLVPTFSFCVHEGLILCVRCFRINLLILLSMNIVVKEKKNF